MRKDITIVADAREQRGKNAAVRLRAEGKSPATVYGPGSDPVAITVNPREITKILQSSTGHNTIFNLDIAGKETTPVMIIDWQRHPVREHLLHIDFKRIDLTKRIQVKVPVHTTGDPKGVKLQGGVYDVVTREVEVDCLPDEIPESYIIDVAELMIGQSIRAGDIPLQGSVKLISAEDLVISHVTALKAEEAAAGEAAAEPEVLKKGKKEEAGADKAPAKKK